MEEVLVRLPILVGLCSGTFSFGARVGVKNDGRVRRAPSAEETRN